MFESIIAMGIIVIIIAGIVAFCGYFLPTIVAVCRGHKNALAIFLINLFLGWSLIGWLGALIWAVIAK